MNKPAGSDAHGHTPLEPAPWPAVEGSLLRRHPTRDLRTAIRGSAIVSIMRTSAILVLMLSYPAISAAAPQRLTCTIDKSGQAGPENSSISVSFDQSGNALTAQRGAQTYKFDNISISNIAVSGHAGSMSLGIDQSSLSIVWQQYDADKIVTEYGRCRRSNP